MSFDFSTLITDRAQFDLSDLRTLLGKPIYQWTEEEKVRFASAASKGAYNYTDLNRVTAAMTYLDEVLQQYGYDTGFTPIKIREEQKPEKPVLPDGYTQLDEITGTGAQYVDTGVILGGHDFTLNIKWKDSGQYNSTVVFGTGEDSEKGYFVLYENTLYLGQGVVHTFDIPIHTEHNLSVSVTKSGAFSGQLDGSEFSGSFSAPVNSKHPLLLFNQTAQNRCRKGSINDVELIVDGVLTRYYKPCITNEGLVGLYDVVGEKFYGNDGTGTFIAGNPVASHLPDGVTQLEYIRFSGNQYTKSFNFGPTFSLGFYVSLQPTTSYYNLYDSPDFSRMLWVSDGGMLELNTNTNRGSVPKNERVLVQSVAEGSTNTVLVNGAQVISLPIINNSGEFTFFNRAGAQCYLGDLYFLPATENGKPKFSLVPCKIQDGSVGLFDTISNTFFGNLGAGGFIAGPEIEKPDPTQEVDPYTWYETDTPTLSKMVQYLRNLSGMCEVLALNPDLPEAMANLSMTGANQIEEALALLWHTIQQVVAGFARSACFSFWSGNRPFPCSYSKPGRTWKELDAMGTTWRNWQEASWYLLRYGDLTDEGEVV